MSQLSASAVLYALPLGATALKQREKDTHAHPHYRTGEDGPTHQPIELASLYRSMPNLLYIRPCDSEETAGAVLLALSAKRTPSMISVSRQNNPQYPEHSSREGVQKGGYVFLQDPDAMVTLLGAGAEMRFAVEAKEALGKYYDIPARIVSVPCWRAFEAQGAEYKRDVLQRHRLPSVAIEAFAMNGWERYADAVSFPVVSPEIRKVFPWTVGKENLRKTSC